MTIFNSYVKLPEGRYTCKLTNMYVNVYCDQLNAIYHPQYYHKIGGLNYPKLEVDGIGFTT